VLLGEVPTDLFQDAVHKFVRELLRVELPFDTRNEIAADCDRQQPDLRGACHSFASDPRNRAHPAATGIAKRKSGSV
jgi:hypothetical protein